MIKKFTGLLAILMLTGWTGHASDAATIGGVVSMNASLGACSDNKIVSGNTVQDSFMLSGAASCDGSSVSANLRGSAATASAGLKASSAGTAQAAAQVQFADQWQLNVPAGTPAGLINIPVSFALKGSISPGAIYDSGTGRFLDYSFTVYDLNGFGPPNRIFQANGQVTSTGDFLQTFNGSVDFRHYEPGFGPLSAAQVEITLFLPGLLSGTVNFYDTASISLDLPPGFSATTSSGLPLVFAPVPLPAAAWLFGSALLGLAGLRRKKA